MKAEQVISSRGDAEGKYDETRFDDDRPQVRHIFPRRNRGKIRQTNDLCIALKLITIACVVHDFDTA